MDDSYAQTLYDLHRRKAERAKEKNQSSTTQECPTEGNPSQYPAQEKFFGSEVKYIIEENQSTQENVSYVVSSTNQVATETRPKVAPTKTTYSSTKRKRITKERIAQAKTQGRI